ncbi:unnamed protein product, partial [Nesidiocoris tenuis]
YFQFVDWRTDAKSDDLEEQCCFCIIEPGSHKMTPASSIPFEIPWNYGWLSDHPLGPRRRRPRRASVSREQPRRNGRRRPEQSEQRRQPRRPSADTHRRIGSQPFGVDIGRRVYARVRLHVPDDDGQHTADTDPGGWHDSVHHHAHERGFSHRRCKDVDLISVTLMRMSNCTDEKLLS